MVIVEISAAGFNMCLKHLGFGMRSFFAAAWSTLVDYKLIGFAETELQLIPAAPRDKTSSLLYSSVK